MKTELEIAKENIETMNDFKSDMSKSRGYSHKRTCKRWLEFSSSAIFQDVGMHSGDGDDYNCYVCENHIDLIDKKIKDLKAAIKLYEDNKI